MFEADWSSIQFAETPAQVGNAKAAGKAEAKAKAKAAVAIPARVVMPAAAATAVTWSPGGGSQHAPPSCSARETRRRLQQKAEDIERSWREAGGLLKRNRKDVEMYCTDGRCRIPCGSSQILESNESNILNSSSTSGSTYASCAGSPGGGTTARREDAEARPGDDEMLCERAASGAGSPGGGTTSRAAQGIDSLFIPIHSIHN